MGPHFTQKSTAVLDFCPYPQKVILDKKVVKDTEMPHGGTCPQFETIIYTDGQQELHRYLIRKSIYKHVVLLWQQEPFNCNSFLKP